MESIIEVAAARADRKSQRLQLVLLPQQRAALPMI
jgi:hypothetical protein